MSTSKYPRNVTYGKVTDTSTQEARHEYYPGQVGMSQLISQNHSNRSSEQNLIHSTPARQLYQKRPSIKKLAEKRNLATEESPHVIKNTQQQSKLKFMLNSTLQRKKADTEPSVVASPKAGQDPTKLLLANIHETSHKSILQLIQGQQQPAKATLNPYMQPNKKFTGSQSDRSFAFKGNSVSQRVIEPKAPPIKNSSPQASLNNLLQTFRQPQVANKQVKSQQSAHFNSKLRADTQHESYQEAMLVRSIERTPKLIVADKPMESSHVLRTYSDLLTPFERKEILEYKSVYYFGQNAQKIYPSEKSEFNMGYDNERGDYNYVINDHIAYRYEVLDRIGKGSFGQTFKVLDHKRNAYSAMKVIRNKKKFHSQALIEIQILKVIREVDTSSSSSLIKIKDYLLFRNHVCILFELLSINLFEFLRQNKFNGVSLDLIRRFAIQLLQALLLLEQQKIIHCDLKPENILLKEPNKSGIKVIDFGSSCFEDEKLYSYIQSRFYRAPEIILGLPYGLPIDMWSFGCIMVELYTGTPLFASESEKDHMTMVMEVIATPPPKMIDESPKRQAFFDDHHIPKMPPNSKGKVRVVGAKPIKQLLQYSTQNFIDFVTGCLCWAPEQRMRSAEALVHTWILEGLPETIREQHLQSMRVCAPWLPLFKQKPRLPPQISPTKPIANPSSVSPRSFLNNKANVTLRESVQEMDISPRQKIGTQGIQGEANKDSTSKDVKTELIAKPTFKSGIQRRRQ